MIRRLCVFLIGLWCFAGCETLDDMGGYRVIAMDVPEERVPASDTPVEGSDCSVMAQFFGQPKLSAALQEAIDSAPRGTRGLKDVRIQIRSSFLLNVVCFEVEGIPMK